MPGIPLIYALHDPIPEDMLNEAVAVLTFNQNGTLTIKPLMLAAVGSAVKINDTDKKMKIAFFKVEIKKTPFK